jgi:hypothetical protein
MVLRDSTMASTAVVLTCLKVRSNSYFSTEFELTQYGMAGKKSGAPFQRNGGFPADYEGEPVLIAEEILHRSPDSMVSVGSECHRSSEIVVF